MRTVECSRHCFRMRCPNPWCRCVRCVGKVFLMPMRSGDKPVVSHLTQHRGKADAVRNFISDSSKRGKTLLCSTSRPANEDVVNCVTVVSGCLSMSHGPPEWHIVFQKCVWLLWSTFWLGWPCLSPSLIVMLTPLMLDKMPVYWLHQLWQRFNWFLNICPFKSYLDFNSEYWDKSSHSSPW